MARWIGVVFGLLSVNVASAQLAGHPSEVSPAAYQDLLPPPPFLDVNLPPAAPPVPYTTAVQGAPMPVPAAPSPVSYDPQYGATLPPPLPAGLPMVVEAPLTIVVYGVADLVVGQGSAQDANQALLAMLAQQSEELAMTLNAAGAGAAQSQQNAALTDLAATIESTFAAEFEAGPGSITIHQGTNSLIVRQTEQMHEQIRALLDQLRQVNDTEISVSIDLVEMDEARLPFAMAHNGQVLTEVEVEEFRALAQQGENEQFSFKVTMRNGESASMPAYGLPGTLTAVAAPDHREVRVILDMLLGFETGLSQQHSHRIPAGGSVLTIFTIEDTSLVLLLGAEIKSAQEVEESATGVESPLLPATHVEPATPCEPVSQTPKTRIRTEALLVEVESLPEDFLSQLVERFECESVRDGANGPCAVLLGSVERDDLVRSLAEKINVRVHSRPTIETISGEAGLIHVGQIIPVIDGIVFDDDEVVPVAHNQEVGVWLNVLPNLTDDGSIDLQLTATHKERNEVETVLYEAPGQTITAPVFDSVSAETSFNVPQGRTLVWPVSPEVAGPEVDGSTLLIFLTSSHLEAECSTH
jgi:Flp pilus assembly secretin CpaC